jgi:hypothetical protein
MTATEKAGLIVVLVWAGGIVFGLTVWAGIIYAAVHFLHKYW